MSKLLPLSIVLLAATSAVSAQTYTVLHNFGSSPGDPSGSFGTITQSRGGGMLTTSSDFEGQPGTAFSIWPSGALQVLHRFVPGSDPLSGLILATDGRFYGTTYDGGTSKLGTIFSMSQNGSVTTLYNFTGGSDGEYPEAAPIQSVGGDLYGTTSGDSGSGAKQTGSVYRITKDGKFTVLHVFTGKDGSGYDPLKPLVQGADSYFYGTTFQGGSSNAGTIFRISSTGDFKVLVNFNGTNGSNPYAALIQANDGNFYGTTSFGGTAGRGVLFRMKPDGALTVLHNFTGGSDGATPGGAIVQASDRNLYGTTQDGGANGVGVLFRATLAGVVVPLHNFIKASGAYPAGLMQHTNGKLYGEADADGKFNEGVFYSLNADLRPFVSYLPTYGQPGALVQILGQGFTSSSEVFFNGKRAAPPVAVYPTYIRVIVPSGATTGPITVTTSNGTLKSNKTFIVHP